MEKTRGSAVTLTRQGMDYAKRHIMIVLCVILLIICSAASPKFLTASNILSILRQNSVVGVLAVGQCIAIIAGGIDSSLAFVMCAGVMALGKVQDLPLAVCLLIVLAFGFALGTVSGVAVAYFNVVPFIATMAMGLVAEGIALLANRGKPIYWQNNHQDYIEIMGSGETLGIPNMVLTFVLIVVVGQIVLSKTKLGFAWRAIGGNSQAAYWSGVRSKFYTMLSLSFSGMMAGAAAMLMVARIGASDPTAGNTTTMDSMAAAVLGGTFIGGKGIGSIAGALLGTFMLGMVNNIFNLVGFSAYMQDITKGIIIILAVVAGSKSVAGRTT